MKKKSYQLLLSFGYIKEDAQEVVNSLFLHKLKDESLCKNILNVYNYLRDYYTKEEIVKMTKLLPALYGLDIENIRQKIDNIEKLGYERKDVIEMTKKLPALFSYSIDNIKRKINFYKSINLENIVLEDTKQLMQSVELSYARYRYLTIKKAEITKDNYSKLFYSQNNFKKRLGIDNKTVKKLYPFEGYLKVQKLYKKLEILSKLNPEASKGILNNSIKKYVDANCSIEKRINNKYDKILKNSKV